MKKLLLYLLKIGEVCNRSYTTNNIPTCIGGVAYNVYIDTSDYQYAVIEETYYWEYENVQTLYKLPLDIIPQKLWYNIEKRKYDESFIITKRL